jgi:hypothetical protein
MSVPILLTAPQFAAIANAAAALCPVDRDPFLLAVAAALQDQLIVGDGTIGRIVREVQLRFPHPEVEPVPPRWARDKPRYERMSRRAF